MEAQKKLHDRYFGCLLGLDVRDALGTTPGIQGAGYISIDPEKYFKAGHSNSNSARVFLRKSKDSIRQSL